MWSVGDHQAMVSRQGSGQSCGCQGSQRLLPWACPGVQQARWVREGGCRAGQNPKPKFTECLNSCTGLRIPIWKKSRFPSSPYLHPAGGSFLDKQSSCKLFSTFPSRVKIGFFSYSETHRFVITAFPYTELWSNLLLRLFSPAVRARPWCVLMWVQTLMGVRAPALPFTSVTSEQDVLLSYTTACSFMDGNTSICLLRMVLRTPCPVPGRQAPRWEHGAPTGPGIADSLPTYMSSQVPATRPEVLPSLPALTLGIISFWNICKFYKWKWVFIIIFIWMYLITCHGFFSYLLFIFCFKKHWVSMNTNHIICRIQRKTKRSSSF